MATFRYPWSDSHHQYGESLQPPYGQLLGAPKDFEAILDVGADLVAMANVLRTISTIESARAHIHDSFSGGLPSEVLVLFEALGTRPKLTKLFLGFHRRHYAPLPLQALSLCLIQASRLTTLEICGLQLDGTKSDFTTLAASLQSHPSLEEIKISNCRIATPPLQLQNNNNHHSEHDDDNDEESHSYYALDPLVRALATIPTLRRIILQSSTKNSLGMLTEEAIGSLCQATNLQAIGLLGFTFDQHHLIALSNGLSSCSSLKELYLGTIQLGTQGDVALARILQQPQAQDAHDNRNSSKTIPESLEYMDLQFQDYESPIAIARALVHNTTLRHFFVHGNLTLTSQETFANAIQHNYHLKSLELMNGSVHLATIRFYLSMNAIGRAELLLGGPNTTSNNSKWVDKLASQKDNISALFYLLSMNPLLCDLDH